MTYTETFYDCENDQFIALRKRQSLAKVARKLGVSMNNFLTDEEWPDHLREPAYGWQYDSTINAMVARVH